MTLNENGMFIYGIFFGAHDYDTSRTFVTKCPPCLNSGAGTDRILCNRYMLNLNYTFNRHESPT